MHIKDLFESVKSFYVPAYPHPKKRVKKKDLIDPVGRTTKSHEVPHLLEDLMPFYRDCRQRGANACFNPEWRIDAVNYWLQYYYDPLEMAMGQYVYNLIIRDAVKRQDEYVCYVALMLEGILEAERVAEYRASPWYEIFEGKREEKKEEQTQQWVKVEL